MLFNLTIKIPPKDDFNELIKQISSDKTTMKYNTYLTLSQTKILVKAIAERKTEIDTLDLESAFPSRKENRLNELIQLWNAAKYKVKNLRLGQNTIPEAFKEHMQNEYRDDKKIIVRVNLTNCDPPDVVDADQHGEQLSSLLGGMKQTGK